MPNERARATVERDATLQMSATIQRNEEGGWLTTVNLGEGASLTKWFATEDEAKRYPDELADWLGRGHE